MKLHLVDINSDVIEAWKASFSKHNEVRIIEASIFDVARYTVVSPANSHGFMDGGIDLVYLRYFGQQIQDRIRELICHRSEGMLPVGSADFISTMNPRIPWMIVAPTMEMPEAVSPLNAQRAFAAVLRLVERHPEFEEIYCPGFCTGVGKISPMEAAIAMEAAYSFWKDKNKKPNFN